MVGTDDDLLNDIEGLIRTTDDTKDRAMILIMQRILLRVEKALADESSLQSAVLRDLRPFHTDDHGLIRQLREENVIEAVQWTNKLRETNMLEVCAYARSKMEQEQDLHKTFRRKFDEFLFDALKAVFIFVLGVMATVGLTALSRHTQVLAPAVIEVPIQAEGANGPRLVPQPVKP